jgi:Na+-driven multidrug efflux pump
MQMKTLTQNVFTRIAAELLPIVANALPVCIAVGLAATIGLVDVHLAGDLGPAVQAGVGIGDQFLFFAALLGTGIAQGAGSLIARETGARHFREAQLLASAGLVLAALLGTAASIATFFSADYLLGLFSQDALVRHSGSTYLKLCAIANMPYCLMLTQSAILRASGKSFSTVFPWFVAAAVSISLSVYLPKVMPEGGAYTLEYIALAWNLGAFTAALIGHFQLKKLGISMLDTSQSISQFLAKAKSISLLGLPIAATEAAWLSSNFFMYIILAQMPSANEAQAAWTIRLKVEEMAATPAILAFNMTAASLVGQQIGAGDITGARTTTTKAAHAATLLMFLVGLLVFLNNGPAGTSHASTPISAQYTQVLLSASVLVYPLTGFYITVFGALEGAGSTMRPMLAVVAGLIILRIPLADWLALHLETGMTGIVISIIISHFAVTLSAVSQMKIFFARSEKSANDEKTSQAQFLPAESANSAKTGTFSMQPVTIPERCRRMRLTE